MKLYVFSKWSLVGHSFTAKRILCKVWDAGLDFSNRSESFITLKLRVIQIPDKTIYMTPNSHMPKAMWLKMKNIPINILKHCFYAKIYQTEDNTSSKWIDLTHNALLMGYYIACLPATWADEDLDP